ncbi:serine protease [Glycomyces sp. TRM65418]|uniref:trypsin-like serine peptidase n=1 Tax=Glycomyces sp. TRM65418 TaxID=2867006 RepID=UPI001CE6721F|nr:serine protease [Glycomyces sp. TRM65418]MCC3762704.1 serine protease [Glycomyces sp. TRM65418]QZD56739.1 serine protease [Glycomyces sp. TRM65418]
MRNPRTGQERTGQGGAGRKRRKAILAATAGALAVGAAAVVVPNAFADDDPVTGLLDRTAEILPVDDSLLGLIDVGQVEELTESLTYADGADTVKVSGPDAGYVKVHFERLLLNAGDYVTVSSPDGSESYRYEESMVDRWATSITGDTAIVELHRGDDAPVSAALGAVIDKAAYGFAPDVVDDLVAERTDRSRPEESICQGDEKRPSACYRTSYPEVVDRSEPVARLLIDGTVLCTAFRVGEANRLLTNNHCFKETWEAQQTEVWFGYDCVACGTTLANAPVKVTGAQVLATSKSLDYTLFTVDDFDRIERFGHLELAKGAARRGEAIYIPQHPAGRPTEIAMDSAVDGGNCVVKQAVYDGYVAGSDIAYYCDTEFGSSGSPVLSRDTHEVIALHHFGGCPNSGVNAQLIKAEIGHLI